MHKDRLLYGHIDDLISELNVKVEKTREIEKKRRRRKGKGRVSDENNNSYSNMNNVYEENECSFTPEELENTLHLNNQATSLNSAGNKQFAS